MKILFTLILLQFSLLSWSQKTGFFSVNTVNDHLVMLDTAGTITDIGPTGHVMNYYTSLAYHFPSHKLYCIAADTLYTVNTNTGYATTVAMVKDSATGDSLFSGRIAFTSKGEAFVFQEYAAFTEGKLYRLNLSNGLAKRVSAYTSGNPSILGIAFDKKDTLFAASESSDNLLKMDTTSGRVTYSSPNHLGMDFTNALNFVPNGTLWGVDINNEYSFTQTRFCTIDTHSGISSLRFTLTGNYAGLAWGTQSTLTRMTEARHTQALTVFPNPNNGSFSISLPGTPGNTDFQLTDLAGRSFKAVIEYRDGTYTCRGIQEKGVYILHILEGGKVYSSTPILVK